PAVRVVHRAAPPGVGRAVRAGLAAARGDAVVIAMADGSDEPRDICTYYRRLQEGYDAVFGSRFVRGGSVEGYPPLKLAINRLGNHVMRLLFGRSENDLSNALKAYRRDVLRAIGPLESDHFEIFVELPLKVLAAGAHVATVPVAWHGQAQAGQAGAALCARDPAPLARPPRPPSPALVAAPAIRESRVDAGARHAQEHAQGHPISRIQPARASAGRQYRAG